MEQSESLSTYWLLYTLVTPDQEDMHEFESLAPQNLVH